jgi:hypothetical protein
MVDWYGSRPGYGECCPGRTFCWNSFSVFCAGSLIIVSGWKGMTDRRSSLEKKQGKRLVPDTITPPHDVDPVKRGT